MIYVHIKSGSLKIHFNIYTHKHHYILFLNYVDIKKVIIYNNLYYKDKHKITLKRLLIIVKKVFRYIFKDYKPQFICRKNNNIPNSKVT